ncbi:hypothetical protein PFISCL1PPCAC_19447 [Pristionchus fissidentatus]|uniref:Uncharacterized protein n=1 Tax=Pristionchus fissidentatus TaxID=1538716 RepID=A0AAV5WC14_9BILA|nr:hypothetical protein PFISCL1PPCAC_19447 [Pristionchus fissidentatus]
MLLHVVAATALALAVQAAKIDQVASCESGNVPIFLLQHNSTVGRQLRTIPAATFGDCSDHCAASNDCVGVEFINSNCMVYEKGLNAPTPGSKILTKTCVKSDRVCSSPFQFDAFEQKILVGFAREVVSAENIQVCLASCLNAFDTFGFECESVMFYPTDQECILNTEDRLDRPDLFVDEHDDTVIYMDNNCAGSQCYAPYITQYIAVEGKQLENELDRIINVDLESCQSLCTQRLSLSLNDFNCKSFMYNEANRTCILSDERSKPLGRADLIPADGFTYFEKKCFASPNTCRNSPSFVRVPQMILVGFAAFVMENVPSVTMCLDQCTNPPPETGDDFVCKSVMYYYNEQECILNSETRVSKPDLFIPEGDDFQVDYFDISCHLQKETCPTGTQLRTIRTLNAALPEGESDLHVLKTEVKSTVSACMKKCFELSPEKCRSFNFEKSSSTCHLLYLDGTNTLRPHVRLGTDLYDMHCLAVENDCTVNKDEALFSRHLHTRQRGIAAKEYKVVSLNSCLEVCARNPTCAGVNYNRHVGQCDVFDAIDGQADINENVDFYKNLCVVKESDTGVSSAANVPEPVHKLSGSATNKDQKGEINALKKVKPPTIHEAEPARRAPPPRVPVGPPVQIPKEAIQTICNYEGIKVQVKNDELFSGVIFVKNKYDTCRVEVTQSNSATLTLGLPKDFGMRPISIDGDSEEEAETEKPATTGAKAKEGLAPFEEFAARHKREVETRDCGLIDLLNGTYKTTVVVQTNNLGIPGLVTSMDQLYEISCDYSAMLGGKVQAGYNMTVNGPEANLIQPRGKIELGNPVAMQMLAGDGKSPVVQAKLGDMMTLRWEIMAMDEELDFFVRECHAEPGSNGANEEKLQLIDGGCPTPAVAHKLIPGPIELQSTAVKTTKMQAFRFDSSSTIRVTCNIEICQGDCTPVECALVEGQRQSFGRKKRDTNSIGLFETARYKVPRYAQSTTSIVIVDPLQQISEPSISLAHRSQMEMNRGSIEESEVIDVALPGEMCMTKSMLLAVFGILLILVVIQALIVGRYVVKRYFGKSAM